MQISAVLRSLGIIALVLIVGCSQPLSTREKSTGIGAVLGAGTGAIIGAAIGSPAAGAAHWWRTRCRNWSSCRRSDAKTGY